MVCLSPRAREEIVHPRRLSGVSARPLNFTVRSHRESRLGMLALVFEACAPFGARWWCPCCTRGLLWAIVAVACMSPGVLMASPDASTNVSSEDVKARCERAADKWFKKNYPLPEEQTSVGSGKATYTSHFSATRNDCFMEAVETAHIRQDGETQIVDSEIHL